MPSVIALLKVGEARAQEDLESWLDVLREAEVQAEAARQRLEYARIARAEVALMFAEGTVPAHEGDEASVASQAAGPVRVAPTASGGPVLREGYDARPPQWQAGLDVGALCGAYRKVFETALAAPGPVTVQELTVALGRDGFIGAPGPTGTGPTWTHVSVRVRLGSAPLGLVDAGQRRGQFGPRLTVPVLPRSRVKPEGWGQLRR